MAVTITTQPEKYFVSQIQEEQRPPISELEITGLWKPEYIGRYVAEKMNDSSLMAQLMIQGRETAVSTDQVLWKEEDNNFSVNIIAGKGLITRAANVFTLNSSAIPADNFDIDSNRPTNAEIIAEVGMNFMVIDPAGEMNHGEITAIAADHRSFTATWIGEGATAWTIGTTDLDIQFYGYNLNHCECAPCIGYKTYAPTRENTMFKDGQCTEYCDETIANEGGGAYDLLEVGQGDFVTVDERLQQAQMALLERAEIALAFGKRKTAAQAAASGDISRGLNGIFPILDDRALKIEGMIETWADLEVIAEHLNREGIKLATLRCTFAQKAKLNALVTPSSPYYVNPFQDNTDSMFYIGFKGVNINGITIIFKEWSALNSPSENLGARYNFVVIPEGNITRVLNGTRTKVGYLQLVWFKDLTNKNYKFMRVESGEQSCGNHKVDYVNKMTIALFHPEKWIIGVNLPEGGA